MSDTFFIFTRRTRKSLVVECASTIPLAVRRGGTAKFSVQWRNALRCTDTDAIMRVAMSAKRYEPVVGGKAVVLDLELAAVALLERGFDVKHIGARVGSHGGRHPECVQVTV